MNCNTVEFSRRSDSVIYNSAKPPLTFVRTSFPNHEKEKLFSDIDFVINKSKEVAFKVEQELNFGADVLEITHPGYTHRELTGPR